MANVREIHRGESSYPERVAQRLGVDAPSAIHVLGDVELPSRVDLALICSVSCPGGVIIKTYDAIRALRDAGIVVAGGFHSPMEVECLDFLLRGSQAVVLCLATGLKHVSLGAESQRAFLDKRLCVLSPFDDDVEHAMAQHGACRNDLVAAIADAVFVPHAAPGGKAAANVVRAIGRGLTVLTFADVANEHLIRAGARAKSVAELIPAVGQSIRHPARDSDITEPRG